MKSLNLLKSDSQIYNFSNNMVKFNGQTIRALREAYLAELLHLYGKEEVLEMFARLVEEYLGLSRALTLLSLDQTVLPEVSEKFEAALGELSRERPLQYIIGKTEFCGLVFFVSEGVLIPRPETEELVEWVVGDNRYGNPGRIMDIGTGSGCIAVSIKKRLPAAEVLCTDVSEVALGFARKNALFHGTEIPARHIDILDPSTWLNLGRFNIIVSNPPYVRMKERGMMKNNVLRYEPQEALFVEDDDPLKYYSGIMEFAKRHLIQGGSIFLEINEEMGEGIRKLAEVMGFSAEEIRKDFRGRDRMIKVCRS